MSLSGMGDMISRMAEVHRVPRRSTLATVSLLLSLFVAAVAMGSGLGTRFGIWSYRVGFMVLRWAVLGAVLAGLCALVAVWITLPLRSEKRGFTLALLGLCISGFVIGIPVQWRLQAREAPPIHDLSTDLEDPPEFKVIPRFRTSEHNNLNRENPSLVSLQRKAYPDLSTLVLNLPRDRCIENVLRVARSEHWVFHSINWAEGRIEATDRTFWFGFRDDVVVRVNTTSDDRCKVDVRSVSRYGESDLGTNARRIRRFLNQLKSN